MILTATSINTPTRKLNEKSPRFAVGDEIKRENRTGIVTNVHLDNTVDVQWGGLDQIEEKDVSIIGLTKTGKYFEKSSNFPAWFYRGSYPEV